VSARTRSRTSNLIPSGTDTSSGSSDSKSSIVVVVVVVVVVVITTPAGVPVGGVGVVTFEETTPALSPA